MSTSVRTIRVVLDASQTSQGAAQANAALRSIGVAGASATGNLNGTTVALGRTSNAAQAAGSSMRAANQNFVASNNSLLNMVRSLGRATIALAGLSLMAGGITGVALALTGASDKAALLEAKLRNATAATNSYGQAAKDVRRIANETRSDLTAIGDLYSKMAKKQGELGLSTAGVAAATSNFAKILKVSGATASESTSSILQLGQAFNKGILNSDEFSSLRENAGDFVKIIADFKGVSLAALAEMSEKGKLTGKVIADALTDPAVIKKVEEQFGRIPVTFQDIRTGIGNAMVDIAGSIAKGLGINSSLAVMLTQIQKFAADSLPFFEKFGAQVRGVFAAIAPGVRATFAVLGPIVMGVVNNMESLVRVAIAAGAGFLAFKASLAVGEIVNAATNVAKLGAFMTGTSGVAAFFAGAMTMARTAVNGLTTALLANPFTAIAVAITATVALLWQFRDSIKVGAGEFGTLGDAGRSLFAKIGPMFADLGAKARSILSSIGGFFERNFGSAWDAAKKLFSGLDLSFFGFMKLGARVNDAVAGFFIGGFHAIKNVWGMLPQAMGAIVTSTANSVISGIEAMVNKAINGINGLIDMANNIPMVNIGKLGNVSMARVPQIAAPNIGAAISSGMARGRGGFGQEAFVDEWRADTARRGAARNARGGSNAPGDPRNQNSTPPGSPAADAGKGGSGESAAEKMAKAMNDFWAGLEASRDAAGLLGFELERHNKILELRKVLGDGDLSKARELTELETQRIEKLLTEVATRKAIADLTQENLSLGRQHALLTQESTLLQTMGADQVKREMAIREAMDAKRAEYARDHADMSETALANALAQHEAALRLVDADRERVRLATELQQKGNALAERYAREADPRGYALRDRNERDAQIRGGMTRLTGESDAEFQRRVTVALEGSARQFQDDLNKVSEGFYNRMTGAIDQIGQQIGGEWGSAISKLGQAIAAMAALAQGDGSKSGIFGGILDLFGGAKGNRNAFGQGMEQGASAFSKEGWQTAFSKPLESLSSSFGNFTNLFKQGGGFMKSLGSVLGAAGQGAQVGSAVAGLGKMLWKDFNSTGAQIGGMIGSVIGGPIGSVLGSIGGGILGGLFGKKKAPSASSSISVGPDGGLTATTSGSKSLQGEAGQASQAVIDGITSIASRLGADMGGMANVSIGKYKNEWKVGADGQAVGKKSGLSFGEDQAAAVKFAIQNAIQDGILTGLSDFSNRLLRSSKNLDAAVSLAEGYEKLLKELANLKDPIGASIREVTDGLNKMVKQMMAAGATSAELANIEEYKKLKLNAILKDQLKSLTDFRRELFGEGSGVSALNQLIAAQNEFGKLDASVRAGGAVDQDEFTRLGQQVLSLGRDVYGSSSSQFQAIRQMLLQATDGAIENVTKSFDDATVVAIDRQTDAITTNQTIQNDLLRQIANSLSGGGAGSAYTYEQGRAVNGAYSYERV